MAKAYMVNTLKKTISIQVMGLEKELPVKGIADGCIGVSLWFDTFENAKAWGGDATIALGTLDAPANQSQEEN